MSANFENELEENINIINKTVTLYGPPINRQDLQLPGPELVADQDIFAYNDFLNKTADNYSLR